MEASLSLLAGDRMQLALATRACDTSILNSSFGALHLGAPFDSSTSGHHRVGMG